MMDINDEDASDDEYNEVSYDELSGETSDEIDEVNELVIDDSEDDSDDSDVDVDADTLKTTMFFPKKGQNTNKIPQIIPMPQLKGIVLPKTKPVIEIPRTNIKKYNAEEIEMILQNMPGINVLANTINYERENVYDLLQKEAQESIKDFNIRKDITLKVSYIEDPKIKSSTCVVIGLMIAKKLRFGVTYEENVETLIKSILDILKTQ